MPGRSKSTEVGDEDREAIAKRLREVVAALGTQADAARVAKVSLRQLKTYLAGKAVPSAMAAGNLTGATGFSLDWLFSGEGPQRRTTKAGESKTVAAYARTLMSDLIESADAFTVLGLTVNSGLQRVYREEGFPLDDEGEGEPIALSRDLVSAFLKLEREHWPMVAPAIVEAQRAALRYVKRTKLPRRGAELPPKRASPKK